MTVLETSEPVTISITGTNFDGAAAPDTIKTFSNPLDIDIRFIASNGAKTQMPDQSLIFVSSETDSTGSGRYFNLVLTVYEALNNRRQIPKIVKRVPVYQLRNRRLAIALGEKRKWYACAICGFCIHLAITDIKSAAVR